MRTTVLTRVIVAGALFLFEGVGRQTALAQGDGIYADFATSMGSFTCRLDSTNAPRATANFVGLATGARPWLNVASGFVSTQLFYDGLAFHRVIANFMIQGGSPNGLGTDGPGYVFPDEITPLLKHDGPGVLAMANSGTNSNGAQFYVTVDNASWLDGSYTIFGRVTSGQTVVNAIGQVATDSRHRPIEDVVLQKVSIRRVGPAAQAFDINAQGLPMVSPGALHVTASPASVELTYTNRLYEQHFISASTNLTTWTSTELAVDLVAPGSNSVQYAMTGPRRYYAMSSVRYPSSTLAPRAVSNRTLRLVFNSGLGTLVVVFDTSGGGAYTIGTSSGAVTSYVWDQGIYRGHLWPIYYSDLFPMTLQLNFTNESGGWFTGTVYSSPSFEVSGSFSI